jgi:hypothetical protein
VDTVRKIKTSNIRWTESRREFLAASAGAAASLSMLPVVSAAKASQSPRLGKADHCIFIWLGGGAGQIDTWDPKQLGDPKTKKPGSYYKAVDTAIEGVQVCEHLSRCAKVLDHFVLVRTVHHEVIDEHAAAVNRMHTGRPTSGSIVYPSVGSIVAHQRGAAGEGVPAYVLIGYPNVTRGPGFLGAKHSYVYLTDTNSGPAGLSRPPEIAQERQARREELLAKVREGFLSRQSDDSLIKQYDATIGEALRLSGPNFKRIFELSREPDSLREAYGGEFGQRCLLARRLAESGVRFIEVSHNLNFLNGTGWDVHNDGIVRQHALIEELDKALATLVIDLEKKRLLDKTLIVVASEFGRPAQFDAGGGRGHHGKSFSVALAGGGLRTGQVIGQTDDLAMSILNRPVSVADLHATIHTALGIDPKEALYAGERPVPITDGGEVIAEAFS